ncbi:hypothetical protein [methanotrophic endosymbiont of Bathymodiolus puteoserpentis (Logatchev)]|uniref:hypothetical protein n=1 Tax=methanotrophic endosymbiont of Bathymodiolus puteoserpentis (Logatchev) TaxID=343235 RepID=UPI0013C81716|nr:hypothetical protein [methanotrophic endosymbiont of Bathymodiolus puteoserpentis (Logatchev)]SHE22213.1 hypothetical protein BPUTEOMOX_2236 [methanotrophic endosymbiont of Bathymodiolus puteoserpentis (Logatchev)]
MNSQLSDWRNLAIEFEQQINQTVLGQQQAKYPCKINLTFMKKPLYDFRQYF